MSPLMPYETSPAMMMILRRNPHAFALRCPCLSDLSRTAVLLPVIYLLSRAFLCFPLPQPLQRPSIYLTSVEC